MKRKGFFVGQSSCKQLLQEAIFDITYNDLYRDWIVDSKEIIFQELNEYEQNKNYIKSIVDIVIVALTTISKATIVIYDSDKEIVKNYIFEPVNSESKTIRELAFINRHCDLIVNKRALSLTAGKNLFNTDSALKSVSNPAGSSLNNSWAEVVGSNNDVIASIKIIDLRSRQIESNTQFSLNTSENIYFNIKPSSTFDVDTKYRKIGRKICFDFTL